MDSRYHLMELPTKVLIGDGVISKLGDFLADSAGGKAVVVAAGSSVTSKVRKAVESALERSPVWVEVSAADTANVDKVIASAPGAGCIVGVGGGKSVDVGKLAAFNTHLPFYSVPTSASHDGISSPFASLKGLDRPYSFMAKPPVGILADISVISSAPRRLLAAGCGDLVSKLTAVKDWQLAHRITGEYYGRYSASLALMSANAVLDRSKALGRFGKDSALTVTVPEDLFLVEGLQIIKRGIANDVFKFVPSLAALTFVEKFNNQRAVPKKEEAKAPETKEPAPAPKPRKRRTEAPPQTA